MELLKTLLEADIELKRGDFEKEKDDPSVPVNFEHALIKDMEQVKSILLKIHGKLNNKELLNKVTQMYSKVSHLEDEKYPALYFDHIQVEKHNPIFSVASDLESAMKYIENIVADAEILEKY